MTTTSDPIHLEKPIQRGDQQITEITLHKPNAGALRNTSLRALLDMEAGAVVSLLPRIAEPKITPAEAAALDPADLLQAGAAIANFLLPSAAKAAAQEQLGLTE